MIFPIENLYDGQTHVFNGRLFEFYDDVWINKNDITPFHHWTTNNIVTSYDSVHISDIGMYPSKAYFMRDEDDIGYVDVHGGTSGDPKIQRTKNFLYGGYSGYTIQHVSYGASVAAWIYLLDYNGSDMTIFRMDGCHSPWPNWTGSTSAPYIYIDGTVLKNKWYYQWDEITIDISKIILLNTWHHICCVRSPLRQQIYIDGVIYYDGIHDTSDMPIYYENVTIYRPDKSELYDIPRFYIGDLTWPVGDHTFHGYLEDIRYYNRDLSTEEISTIYNKGKGIYGQNYIMGSSSMKFPKYWFKFNEDIFYIGNYQHVFKDKLIYIRNSTIRNQSQPKPGGNPGSGGEQGTGSYKQRPNVGGLKSELFDVVTYPPVWSELFPIHDPIWNSGVEMGWFKDYGDPNTWEGWTKDPQEWPYNSDFYFFVDELHGNVDDNYEPRNPMYKSWHFFDSHFLSGSTCNLGNDFSICLWVKDIQHWAIPVFAYYYYELLEWGGADHKEDYKEYITPYFDSTFEYSCCACSSSSYLIGAHSGLTHRLEGWVFTGNTSCTWKNIYRWDGAGSMWERDDLGIGDYYEFESYMYPSLVGYDENIPNFLIPITKYEPFFGGTSGLPVDAQWSSCDCGYNGDCMVISTWSGRTHIYQLKEPGTASENTTSGTKQWEDKDGIKTEGDKYAHVELLRGGDEISYIIQATNFNFDIPDRSVIVGIRAVYKFMQYSNTSSYGISSCFVKIMKGGGIVGTDHADSGDYWDDSDWEYRNYGSETDLWGTAWTYSDIRDIGFGVSLQAQQNVGGYSEARIDHVAIYVYYIPPPRIVGVYASVDKGHVWEEIATSANYNMSWNTVSISGNLCWAGNSRSIILMGGSDVKGSWNPAYGSGGSLILNSHSLSTDTYKPQSPGGINEIWTCSAIDSDASVLMVGSSISSGSTGGYLYTGYTIDSGAPSGVPTGTWYKVYPAGDVQKNWRCCDVNYNGSTMIAGVYGGRIYTGSTTGSWYEVRPAGNSNKNWTCCACNYDGSIMLAGVYGGYMYLSYDRGLNWIDLTELGSRNWLSCSISKEATVSNQDIYYNNMVVSWANLGYHSGGVFILNNTNRPWIAWNTEENGVFGANWFGDISGNDVGKIGVHINATSGDDKFLTWDLGSNYLWKNGWHNFVLTQKQIINTPTDNLFEFTIFYDGVEQSTQSSSLCELTSDGFVIGRKYVPPQRKNFQINDFYISDLRIYDYVLNPNEVKNIYNVGSGITY